MWFEECELKFLSFIKLLITTPNLTILVEGEGFTVYCDAFGVGLGCIDVTKLVYCLCLMTVYPTQDL